MVRYSAIIGRQKVIDHLSQYFDDISETDLPERLDELKLSADDYLKIKYVDKLGLKLTCIIQRADKKKYALTETFRS